MRDKIIKPNLASTQEQPHANLQKQGERKRPSKHPLKEIIEKPPKAKLFGNGRKGASTNLAKTMDYHHH
jgi:hypothetical protein